MIAVKRKKQFLTNEKGQPVAVVLDLKTYQQIQDDLDDYYCRKAYERAVPTTNTELKRGEYSTIKEFIAKRALRNKGKRNGRKR